MAERVSSNILKITSPIWDLTDVQEQDDSFRDYQLARFAPDNAGALANAGSFILRNTEVNKHTYMPGAKIRLAIRLLPTGGGNYGANDAIALQNLPPLFQQASLYVGGEMKEQVQELPIAQLITHLLNYSKEYIESGGADGELFYLDTGAGGAVLEENVYTLTGTVNAGPPRVVEIGGAGVGANVDLLAAGTGLALRVRKNPAFNEGFKRRHERCKGSRNIVLDIPLHAIFGYFRDIKKATTGIEYNIELIRQTNVNTLVQLDGTVVPALPLCADVEFRKMELWVPTFAPSLEAELRITKSLEKNSQLVHYFERTMVVRLSQIAGGADLGSFSTQITKRPNKICLAILENTALANANQQNNNRIFANCGMTQITMEIAGMPYPTQPYRMKFNDANTNSSDYDYTRPYEEYKLMTRKDAGEDGGYFTSPAVDMPSYAALYPIFCWDTSKLKDDVWQNSPTVAFHCTGQAPPGGAVPFIYYTYDDKVVFTSQNGKLLVA